MEITIKGDAKEIAVLVLAVQERQEKDVFSTFAEGLHQELWKSLEAARADRESQ